MLAAINMSIASRDGVTKTLISFRSVAGIFSQVIFSILKQINETVLQRRQGKVRHSYTAGGNVNL